MSKKRSLLVALLWRVMVPTVVAQEADNRVNGEIFRTVPACQVVRIGRYSLLLRQKAWESPVFTTEEQEQKQQRFSLTTPARFDIKRLNLPKLHDPYAAEKITPSSLFMDILFENILFPDSFNNSYEYRRSTIDD